MILFRYSCNIITFYYVIAIFCASAGRLGAFSQPKNLSLQARSHYLALKYSKIVPQIGNPKKSVLTHWRCRQPSRRPLVQVGCLRDRSPLHRPSRHCVACESCRM